MTDEEDDSALIPLTDIGVTQTVMFAPSVSIGGTAYTATSGSIVI